MLQLFRHVARSLPPTALLFVAMLVGGEGCKSSPPAPAAATSAPPTDAERGRSFLAADQPLPPRAEVVALADDIAVAASRDASEDEQARLYRLAADLRARVWRGDRADADAREAMELYASSARSARGKELGCEADRARALLMGEVQHDANLTYRTLYLVKRKYGALAASGESPCVAALGRDLAMTQTYRPGGEALAALEKEGDRAEMLAKSSPAPALPTAASSALPITSAAPQDTALRDVVVAPVELAPATGPVRITQLDKYPGEGGGRVVVQLSAPTSFKVGALEADAGKDPRIFVDIDRAVTKGIAKEQEVGGAIKRVRVGPRDDGARIVLDLSAKMHRRVFYLPQPFRIVIDVSARPPERPASPGGGPRTIKRVAIDAGHGGHDAGAIGPTGLNEKDVTLDIARRVAPLLAEELKIEALLTRDEDVFVPLDERTARANAFHADLFVSIHCNASETGEARGIEVFILDEVKDMNRASARIAALENGVPLKTALDPSALDAEMASIASRLGSGQIAASSRMLASLLGRATLASLSERYPDTSDHGVKSAGFYVLVGAEMPAVLFETSFISNPDDEARLAKADYKQKLADGIVNAIRAYRDGKT